jgi:hypothetical protein
VPLPFGDPQHRRTPTVRFKTIGGGSNFDRQKTRIQKVPLKTPFLHFLIQKMSKKGQRKSKHNAPPTTSRTTSTKPKSNPKTTVTKIKIKKFVHPDDIDKDSSPESEEVLIPVPESILDVSVFIYILHTSYLLGETSVLEDITFYKLAEFGYHNFIILTIKKVETAVVELRIGFIWISGMIILSTKSIVIKNQLRMIVDDSEDWKKVELGIEYWMREKKIEISINLIIQYKKIPSGNDGSSEDEDPPLKKIFPI